MLYLFSEHAFRCSTIRDFKVLTIKILRFMEGYVVLLPVMTTPYITRNRSLNLCYEKAYICSLSYSPKFAPEPDSNLGYSPVIQSTSYQHMLKGRYAFTRTRNYSYIPVEATVRSAVATFTISTSLATALAIISTSFLMANVVSEV